MAYGNRRRENPYSNRHRAAPLYRPSRVSGNPAVAG